MEEITVEEKGGRLDQYLMAKTDMSRTKIQKMIREKAILVNDKPSKNSHQVEIGDIITIAPFEEEAMSHEAEDIPLDIDLSLLFLPNYFLLHIVHILARLLA